MDTFHICRRYQCMTPVRISIAFQSHEPSITAAPNIVASNNKVKHVKQKSVFPLKSYNITIAKFSNLYITSNHHTTFHSVLARAYVLMRLKILHQTTFQPSVNHTNT